MRGCRTDVVAKLVAKLVARVVVAAAVLVAIAMALPAGCYSQGTANRRVGILCTTLKDCESVCWEGTCTLACQSDVECPEKMICIAPGVCAFACVLQRECGGWKCTQRIAYESRERVMACVPRLGGGDPEDYEEEPAQSEE